MQNKLTIVNATKELTNHPLIHLEKDVLDILYRSYPNKDKKSYFGNVVTRLLDCFLGVSQKRLTYLDLSDTKINRLFGEFLSAINSPCFLDASGITRDSYRRCFIKALEAMSTEVPDIDISLIESISNYEWVVPSADPLTLEYYKGWPVTGKQGKRKKYLNIADIWNEFGPNAARKTHSLTSDYLLRFDDNSMVNFVPAVNAFMEFLVSANNKITATLLKDPFRVAKLQDNYCRHVFDKSVKNNNCIKTEIKRWNDSLPILNKIVSESGIFAKPIRGFAYLEPNRKDGKESNVKINKNGVEVKDKIAIEVPLFFSDDEAIEFLFVDIKERVDAITTWAEKEASSIYKRHKASEVLCTSDLFALSGREILRRMNRPKKSGCYPKLSSVAYDLGLPTSYSLEPFMYLLIKEHCNITESFLLNLELFSKDEKLVGIEKTDNTTKLVGYKKRKGGKSSQQKITLSKKAIQYVEHVISITRTPREYLKNIGDDNYRFLFLNCGRGFSKPIKCQPLSKGAAYKERINQFAESTSLNKTRILDLVSRLSMTKFRATCGVQVFLETRSVKKMSEALGHEKYKPDLISHYLPEPILKFFQDRWIRIFQKGIVCEVMKDSPNLLRASHFKSIGELDEFLSKNAIQLPPENEGAQYNNHKSGKNEVYISADKSVLKVLLSIEKAVEEANNRVHPKALYWARFSNLLSVEIEKNSYDKDLIKNLKSARNEIETELVSEFIYA